MQKIVKENVEPQCRGCGHVEAVDTCECYYLPAAKWRFGNCPSATHLEEKQETPLEKKHKGQKKQAKQPKLSPKQQKFYGRIGRQ